MQEEIVIVKGWMVNKLVVSTYVCDEIGMLCLHKVVGEFSGKVLGRSGGKMGYW